MSEKFLKVALACYDNDDLMNDDVAAAEAAAAEAAATAAAAAAAADAAKAKKDKGPKVFTQDDVNKFLAEDRRKHVQKLEQLEGAYKDALANQNLSKEQREQLESKLEDLQKTFRSREQQLEHDKKELEERYGKEVKELESKATTWEQKYKQTLIDRSLQDAAVVNDAFNISQIVSLLRPMTVMVEKTNDQGQSTGEAVPMVDLTDIDTTNGEPIITRRTPEAAVKRMKELPSLFGNLFKSNVVSGIGAGTATGGNASGSGTVDPKKISVQEYMRLRKENPAALGLKPRS
jgi:hypothetical protein